MRIKYVSNALTRIQSIQVELGVGGPRQRTSICQQRRVNQCEHTAVVGIGLARGLYARILGIPPLHPAWKLHRLHAESVRDIIKVP